MRIKPKQTIAFMQFVPDRAPVFKRLGDVALAAVWPLHDYLMPVHRLIYDAVATARTTRRRS